MSGLEILLWCWVAISALWSGYTISLVAVSRGGGRLALVCISGMEFLFAVWLGSWAVTLHHLIAVL